MRKKKSGLIVIIVLLLVVLIAGGAFAYVYMATDLLRTDKELFLKYFSQIVTEGEFVDSNIQQYNEKKQQTPYENEGKITVAANIPEEYNVPTDSVNNLSINFSGKTDTLNRQIEQNIEVDYGNDVVFPLTYKQYEDSFGVQFDHFGSKYIAIRNENLKELVEKFGVEDTSEIPDKIELSEVKEEIKFSTEEIEQIKQIYGTVLQEQLLEENFSSIKTANGESYILQLSGEQIKNIIVKMLEATKQNTLLIDKVNEYMLKIDEDSETLDVDAIDELIESVNEEDFSEISDLKITLVQKDKMLNQIVIESGDNKITIAKNSAENQLAYQVNIDMKQVEEESSTEINAYFTAQYTGIQTLDNVEESFDIGFEVASEDMDMGYEYSINNTVQFQESISIEKFDKSKAVFLNDYEAEVVTNFISQVGTRLSEINKNQMAELGLEEDENPLLYSNPITMLGLTIYNMASETIEDTSLSFEDQAIAAFNAKFEMYVGTSLSGSNVNALIRTIQNNNLSDENKIVTITLDGNQLSDTEKVESTDLYSIEAIYDGEGYITEMQITKESD